MTVGRRRRSYLLYVPAGATRRHGLPLVLVYHGAEDTAADTVNETGLLSLDEQRYNMILVFLQGYENTWNDDAGNPPAEAAQIDDVGFTTAVLRRIESNYGVDRRAVVVTGFSNGAILAQLLGCRIATYLTAIVPVEGQLATSFSRSCRPHAPLTVYEVHATADPVIPYAGGTFAGVGGPVTVLSAPASVDRWAVLDQCAAHAPSAPFAGGVLTRYRACRDGVTVALATIQGGAHQWPPGLGQALEYVLSSLPGMRRAAVP